MFHLLRRPWQPLTPAPAPAVAAGPAHRPAGHRADLRRQLFQEEMRHFLQGPARRLSLPPLVALTAGLMVGLGHVPVALLAVLMGLGAAYAWSRYALAGQLRRAVQGGLTREQVRGWRHRLGVHLGLQGALWGTAALVTLPMLTEPLVLLFLCVMITVLGVVCSLLPAPAHGLRVMCLLAVGSGMGGTLLADVGASLQQGIIVCSLIGLCSQELIIQRNMRAIRGRLRDVCRREALRQRLEASNAKLAELIRSKTLLLATASHDLRQPAHALALLADRLGSDPDPLAAAQRFDTIRTTSDYLQELLNKLMDFSRVELGKQPVALADVDVHALVAQTLAAVREVAARKGLYLRAPAPGTARYLVRADPALLRRVLHNLLDNAVKFTPTGGIECHISRAGPRVALTITDTGPGIPAEVLQAAGGPYIRRSDTSLGGLGLGLGVVRGLCQLMGCTLAIEPAPGSGTRIVLGLPYRRSTAADRAVPLRMPANVSGLRVLLVDNHPVILAEMKRLLTDMGHRVRAFESADDALAAGATGSFDLVVSDLHLGAGDNGLDLVRRLRSGPGHTGLPALLITGDIGFSVPDDAGAPPVVVLYKPVRPDKLRRTVQTLAGTAMVPAAAPVDGARIHG